MDDQISIALKQISDKVHEFVMPTIVCNAGVTELVTIMQRIKSLAQISESYQIFVSNVDNFLNTDKSSLIVKQIKKQVDAVFGNC
jgi:hypothetical protein